MRHRFVRMALAIAFLVLLINGTAAQGYRQLTTADFRGIPQPAIENGVAYTNCTIQFQYDAIRYNRQDYHLNANVQLLLNRDKSWLDTRKVQSKKMLEEILNHEQGHYMIAYMEQQELLRQVNRTRFNASYRAQASALFDRIDAKYQQLNANYDDDTRHMLDRIQQHSWDVYFQKRLAYIPPVRDVGD